MWGVACSALPSALHGFELAVAVVADDFAHFDKKTELLFGQGRAGGFKLAVLGLDGLFIDIAFFNQVLKLELLGLHLAFELDHI